MTEEKPSMGEARIPYAARRIGGELIVRDAETEGRSLFGTVVPYGEVATVNDGAGPYKERFAQGAFTRSIEQAGDKVRLYTQHDRRRLPIGKAVEYDDQPDGLRAAFHVANTSEGNDALTLVREGVVDSFSVGFRGLQAAQDGEVTVRTEAALLEVSLVAEPAYKTAVVAGIRSEELAELDADEIAEWVDSLPAPTRAAIQAAFLPADGTEDPNPDEAPPERHGRNTKTIYEALLRLRDF